MRACRWLRGCGGECPAFGTEGDNHVCDEAGECRALFDATEERSCDGAVLGTDVYGEAREAFGEEFKESFGGEAFKDEG